MSEPVTAPTTGADETLIDQLYVACEGFFDYGPEGREAEDGAGVAVATHMAERFAKYGLTVVDATAVPDAAAIRRLLEISQLAQGLLLMHGAFGQPWPNSDLGKQLTAALEAITLPHDWEGVSAWLAQQEGRDGNG